MDISVIIPLYNEEESLPELSEWIVKVMIENKYSYEEIFNTLSANASGSFRRSMIFISPSPASIGMANCTRTKIIEGTLNLLKLGK